MNDKRPGQSATSRQFSRNNETGVGSIPLHLLGKEGSVMLSDPGNGDGERRRILFFHDPVMILHTSRTGEVEGILREIDRHVNDGLFAAGYLAYEAGYAFVDRLAQAVPESFPFDLVWFGIYRSPGIVFHDDIIPLPGLDDSAAYDPSWVIDREAYIEKIEHIRELLRTGEIYQANYTWRAALPPLDSPERMFSALISRQQAPYSSLLNTGSTRAVSLSPELFFMKKGNRITTRPMKGTIRRGSNHDEDEALRVSLASSEKDRAENLMIVDLLRNDLNRICIPGSVLVPELFTVEKYPTLFQMTSTVTGTLQDGTGCADIFASLFPCGSVTGAPKVRAMEIIREIEHGPRGIYTGSIGYIAPGGDALFNVAIRTIVDNTAGTVIGVGSGIVWDSDPESEYRECQLKLEFLRGRDRSFCLIESMLCENLSIPFLQRHVERMSKSAAAMDIPLDRDAMRSAIDACLGNLDQDTKYKIRVTCNSTGSFSSGVSKIETSTGTGTVVLANKRTRPGDPFLYHKTTNRELYDREHRRARDLGHEDALFINTRGEITEGCISNIFVRRNGILYTPPVSCGLLPGVMRAHVLATETAVLEKVLYPCDLYDADEIFICNAVRGMRKVKLAGLM